MLFLYKSTVSPAGSWRTKRSPWAIFQPSSRSVQKLVHKIKSRSKGSIGDVPAHTISSAKVLYFHQFTSSVFQSKVKCSSILRNWFFAWSFHPHITLFSWWNELGQGGNSINNLRCSCSFKLYANLLFLVAALICNIAAPRHLQSVFFWFMVLRCGMFTWTITVVEFRLVFAFVSLVFTFSS